MRENGSGFAEHRQRFRQWRRDRPFWAGLFLVLGGVQMLLPAYATLRLGDLVVSISTIGGVSSLVIGVLLIALGVSLWVRPQYRVIAAITSGLLSLVALATSNLGGFLIGTLLGLIGTALALAWGERTPRSRRRIRKRRGDQEATGQRENRADGQSRGREHRPGSGGGALSALLIATLAAGLCTVGPMRAEAEGGLLPSPPLPDSPLSELVPGGSEPSGTQPPGPPPEDRQPAARQPEESRSSAPDEPRLLPAPPGDLLPQLPPVPPPKPPRLPAPQPPLHSVPKQPERPGPAPGSGNGRPLPLPELPVPGSPGPGDRGGARERPPALPGPESPGLPVPKPSQEPGQARPGPPVPGLASLPAGLAPVVEPPNMPTMAAKPWTLSASKLELSGARFNGVTEVPTAAGPKRALWFTADRTTVTGLTQTAELGTGKTLRISAPQESVSTVEHGPTQLFTEQLKGNLQLLGLSIPVNFTPDMPPPLTPPNVTFTDATVTNVGQLGGDLDVPGARLSLQ